MVVLLLFSLWLFSNFFQLTKELLSLKQSFQNIFWQGDFLFKRKKKKYWSHIRAVELWGSSEIILFLLIRKSQFRKVHWQRNQRHKLAVELQLVRKGSFPTTQHFHILLLGCILVDIELLRPVRIIRNYLFYFFKKKLWRKEIYSMFKSTAVDFGIGCGLTPSSIIY